MTKELGLSLLSVVSCYEESLHKYLSTILVKDHVVREDEEEYKKGRDIKRQQQHLYVSICYPI